MEKEEKWLQEYEIVGTFEEVEAYMDGYQEENGENLIIEELTHGMGNLLYGVKKEPEGRPRT